MVEERRLLAELCAPTPPEELAEGDDESAAMLDAFAARGLAVKSTSEDDEHIWENWDSTALGELALRVDAAWRASGGGA